MSWFKTKIVDRLKEPSSMAGLGLIVAGVGQTFDINEAQGVSEALNQAAQQPSWFGAIMAGLGFVALMMREKGGQK